METVRRFYARIATVATALALTSCASGTRDPVAVANTPAIPATFQVLVQTATTALPDWPGDNGDAGLFALRESCLVWARLPSDRLISEQAPYAGYVRDWARPCNALAFAPDYATAIRALSQELVPLEVVPDDRNRFTGYFEPEIEVRSRPEGRFTEPVPGVPADLVRKGNGQTLQRLSNGATRPYPPRADIDLSRLPVLAYARPEDVFFLQIQGSGRMQFPNGRVARAAFAAHNARPFKGIANWLFQRGKIGRGEMGMQGIKSWMAIASPADLREAMNANPRFVFFEAEEIGNEARGPKGAMGVPLTPWGSLAVDTKLHPLGIPVYVETSFPQAGTGSAEPLPYRGLMVAQDTGGAILGPVRGDIYFGTGDRAGAQASMVNVPGRLWVLLPVAVAERLRAQDVGS